jgi:hypothetical protein
VSPPIPLGARSHPGTAVSVHVRVVPRFDVAGQRAPSRPRRLPGPGPRSPSARAGRNTGPVPRPHPERSYLPGSPPHVPQPLSTSPQTATLTSCQVRRLRRRWPDPSVGLRPWEAPADARRATPHGAQMNPPRVCSRATSTSTWRRRISADTSPAALIRTSRCTRFLPTFGSGTRWSNTRALGPAILACPRPLWTV